MRVTNRMIANQVVFNMQRSINRLLQVQTNMSSGRRINRPSDDPIGIVRDLGFRNELQRIDQFRKNITQALNWTVTYDNSLADVGSFISTAKEVAVSMANGTFDDVAREGSANEIESIFQQIMQLSNVKLDGRTVYSGFKTRADAFQATSNGVIYLGDRGQIEFEVESGRKNRINLIGSDLFLGQILTLGENADLNIGVTGASLLADLKNGTGIDLVAGTFTITDRNSGITSTIDISAAVDLNDVITTINTQLAADGITTLEAKLGLEGNNLLLDATPDGLITGVTPLANLRSGAGIDLQPGTIRVSDGAGIDIIIDLSGSTTVDDIITAFNAQISAAGISNVTMSINPAGTGIVINDTNPVPLGLTITDTSLDSKIAEQFGIDGLIGSGNAGLDLNPITFFDVSELGGTTASDLGIQSSFTGDLSGEDMNPLLTAASALADLRNGQGINLGEIVLKQGERSAIIDLTDPAMVTIQDFLDAVNNSGLDITASLNPDASGIQIVNNDNTRSFSIEESSNGNTAKELGLFGASDMMATLLVLINSLRANDQEGVGLLLENLDESILVALKHRATVGARALALETTNSRLLDLSLNFTKLLSEVEDADFNKIVTDLATQENNYRAALISAGKIIQPSLLDFLSR